METPSSSRRITRSQALAAASSNGSNGVPTSRKFEESDNVVTKSRQRNNNGKPQYDRSPLIDITNDSPIVGVAAGNLGTPSSAMKRFSSRTKIECTPGSGEALLRGQVKTLLQKVEEEAELSKLTIENRPSTKIQGFIHSPMAFAAPTPANTPQILDLSAGVNPQSNGSEHFSQDEFVISQVNEIFEGKKESEKNLMITRSLLLDFSEKSEGSSLSPSECLSEVTIQGKERTVITDDDDASIWSIQVNASTKDEQEDDEEEGLDEVEEECDSGDYDEEENVEEDESGLLDELCEAISQINVNGESTTMEAFAGKHIRFLYNSDDEIEGEVEAEAPLNLKGLPTPTGKHLRFPDY